MYSQIISLYVVPSLVKTPNLSGVYHLSLDLKSDWCPILIGAPNIVGAPSPVGVQSLVGDPSLIGFLSLYV